MGAVPFPASPQSLRPPDVPRNNALFPAFLPTLQLLQVFVRTFSHIFLPRQPESPRRPEGLFPLPLHLPLCPGFRTGRHGLRTPAADRSLKEKPEILRLNSNIRFLAPGPAGGFF